MWRSLRSQFREKGDLLTLGETAGSGGYRGLGHDTWLEKWLDPGNLRACIWRWVVLPIR